jgi:hypothetical protein
MDGGPRAKGGKASIGKPTYLMKTHKPNQKKERKNNLNHPRVARPFQKNRKAT